MATFSKASEGTKQRVDDHPSNSSMEIITGNTESMLHAHLCEVLAINPQTNIPDNLLLAELGLDFMGEMEIRASIA